VTIVKIAGFHGHGIHLWPAITLYYGLHLITKRWGWYNSHHC